MHPLFHIVAVLVAGADGGLRGIDGGTGDALHDLVILLFQRVRGALEHFAEQIGLLPHPIGGAPQLLQAAAGAQVLPKPHERRAEQEKGVRKGDEGGRDGGERREIAPRGGEQEEDAGGDELGAQEAEDVHSRYPTPRTVEMAPSAPIERSFSRRRLMLTYSAFSST